MGNALFLQSVITMTIDYREEWADKIYGEHLAWAQILYDWKFCVSFYC